jgi:hypothetical protein
MGRSVRWRVCGLGRGGAGCTGEATAFLVDWVADRSCMVVIAACGYMRR